MSASIVKFNLKKQQYDKIESHIDSQGGLKNICQHCMQCLFGSPNRVRC